MTFVNEGDFISFRHHVFVKTSHKEVQLAEVGPRFEMRRELLSLSLSLSLASGTTDLRRRDDVFKAYEIKNGTIEQNEADVEWVLRPYMRTGRKRNQL